MLKFGRYDHFELGIIVLSFVFFRSFGLSVFLIYSFVTHCLARNVFRVNDRHPAYVYYCGFIA